jgi:hypothetical protein
MIDAPWRKGSEVTVGHFVCQHYQQNAGVTVGTLREKVKESGKEDKL